MRPILFVLPLFLSATAAAAAERAEIDRLWTLLEMDAVVDVMREEGIDYGESLDADMLEGRGGAGFAAEVSRIYDTARMAATAHERFAADLAGEDVGPMLEFFEADLGRRAIGLEVSARRALLDPEVEAASRDRVAQMDEGGDPRIGLLQRFIEINDLVESNVTGALNSSFAFYRGLADTGALEGQMGEEEILADVWSQEPDVRSETEDWVWGFLALAYQPLSDADLNAYSDFSATEAGQVLNRAIFVAFDQMFVDISHELGQATGHYLVGQEL
jgi:hypothetical protein